MVYHAHHLITIPITAFGAITATVVCCLTIWQICIRPKWKHIRRLRRARKKDTMLMSMSRATTTASRSVTMTTASNSNSISNSNSNTQSSRHHELSSSRAMHKLRMRSVMYRKKTRKTDMPRYYRNSIVLCGLSCVACIYSDLSHFVWSFVSGRFMYDVLLDDVYALSDIFYYCGSLSFYLIAVQRIHISFGETIYGVKRCTMVVLLTLIALSFAVAVYYVYRVATIHDSDDYLKYDTAPSVFLTFNDLLLNTVLLGIFLLKLRQCVITSEKGRIAQQNMHGGGSDDSNEDDGRGGGLGGRSVVQYFSESSDNMMDVIVRHTILFGIAIMTNQFFFLVVFICIAYGFEVWYLFIFRTLENLANVSVLFLNLQQNRKAYYAMCAKCDHCLRHLCVSNTKETIIHDYYVEMQDLNSSDGDI